MVSGLEQATCSGCQGCEVCRRAKLRATPHPRIALRAAEPLELVHSDVCAIPGSVGVRGYFVTLVDDHSGYGWLGCVNHKSDTFSALRRGITFLEFMSKKPLRSLKSDRGGEYMGAELAEYLEVKGVLPCLTPPYSPESNGRAERLNSTLLTRMRCLMLESGLPDTHWREAAEMAMYQRNRCPVRHLSVTPFQALTGQVPDLSGMRVFGCKVYVRVEPHKRSKLEPTSEIGWLLGYDRSGGYKVLVRGKSVITRDVSFDESVMYGDVLGRTGEIAKSERLQEWEVQDACLKAPQLVLDASVLANLRARLEQPIGVPLGEPRGEIGAAAPAPGLANVPLAPVEEHEDPGVEHAPPSPGVPAQPVDPFGVPEPAGPAVRGRAGVQARGRGPAAVQARGPVARGGQPVGAGVRAAPVGQPAVGSPMRLRNRSTIAPKAKPVDWGYNHWRPRAAREVAGRAEGPAQAGPAAAAPPPAPEQSQGSGAEPVWRGNAAFEPESDEESSMFACVKPVPFESDECALFAGLEQSVFLSYQQATSSPEAPDWDQAMGVEYLALEQMGVFETAELPPGTKALPTFWHLTVKRDTQGRVAQYKARLVVMGNQQQGVEVDDVYAPVSRYATVRAFLSEVCAEDLECHQFDVSTAFLNAEVEGDVYVLSPPGWPGGAGRVLKLRKALYGLRQAPRAWYECMRSRLRVYGFEPCKSEPALFIAYKGGVRVLLLLYVDDALVASKSLVLVQEVIDHVRSAFKIKYLGEASVFLGFQITRDRAKRELTITQAGLVREYLDEFRAEAGRTLPLSPGAVLQKKQIDEEEAKGPYARLLGCLMYLACGTRPDIAFACSVLARYMSAPSKRHWSMLWGVLRYVASTPNRGIRYSAERAGVEAYSDADYASCVDTRRSVSGRVFMLNGGAIAWGAKQQATVAFSTVEAEAAAGVMALKECMWLRGLLIEMGHSPFTVDLLVDNTGAIRNIVGEEVRPRLKHVAVAMSGLRDYVRQGLILPSYVPTSEMAADILTKALPLPLHQHCVELLGMVDVGE
jgi:hypothetical protein